MSTIDYDCVHGLPPATCSLCKQQQGVTKPSRVRGDRVRQSLGTPPNPSQGPLADRGAAQRKARVTGRARAEAASVLASAESTADTVAQVVVSPSADFRDRVVAALEGAADEIDVGGVESLAGIVPDWLLERIDPGMAPRFARAARELAGAIDGGVWDWSLPRCTADELLLHRSIDVAKWGAAEDGLDYSDEAEAASEALLQDDDVLMFWTPEAEHVLVTDEVHGAMPDLPSTDPSQWWNRFLTTGEERQSP